MEDDRFEASCWKRIGVWGDAPERCPKLAEVVHCRNCEIYYHAGRSLLERDLPEGYATEWANAMAAQKEDDTTGSGTVVIFRIEDEWMALPARIFAEVMEPEKPHSIPGRNGKVLMGIINVHGELHLCVSLLNLLGIDPRKASADTGQGAFRRMVVVDKDGERWVFPVDEIYGVQRVSLDAFENVPVTVSRGESTFTRSIFHWKDRSVALLDDGLLFTRLTRSVQ